MPFISYTPPTLARPWDTPQDQNIAPTHSTIHGALADAVEAMGAAVEDVADLVWSDDLVDSGLIQLQKSPSATAWTNVGIDTGNPNTNFQMIGVGKVKLFSANLHLTALVNTATTGYKMKLQLPYSGSTYGQLLQVFATQSPADPAYTGTAKYATLNYSTADYAQWARFSGTGAVEFHLDAYGYTAYNSTTPILYDYLQLSGILNEL